MFRKFAFLSSSSLFFIAACSGGFEKFAPPANSISGRGAKVNPKILSSTPSDGSTVAQNPGSGGTQIKVIFDMTMRNDTSPVINTWVRDIGSNNDIIWYPVANSGATFTWSSTTYANDTVTIQLGWVRWPENNIIGFDFDNSTLMNLDDMPLSNENKISFTVGWNPGRYKVVQTGQDVCYSYELGGTPENWHPRDNCVAVGGDHPVGSQNFPAGQNGFIEPRNSNFGPTLYGTSAGGNGPGRRFMAPENPMNLIAANCTGSSADQCFPYTIDPVTSLVWKTCSQGSNYKSGPVTGDKCTPVSAADYTWGQAVNACSSLNTANGGQGYGGRKDWRLPTIDELENLVDYGARAEVGEPEPSLAAPEIPAIDGNDRGNHPAWEGAFPNTPLKGFWTATGLSARLNGQTYYGETYVVEFKKGSMGAGGGTGSLLESKRATSNRKKVRCVAGPFIEPAAQNLTPVVIGNGAALTGTGAAFWGYDANPVFHVQSAVPSYSVETNQHVVTVTFNKAANSSQAGTPGNYCIGSPGDGAGCTPVRTVDSAVQISSTQYKLILNNLTPMGPNTPYKLRVSGVQSFSDQWLTGQAYTVNTYVSDSGNVYRVAIAHTSATIGGDIGLGNLELLANFAAGTPYTAGTKLYVASSSQVVNVQSGYTATASVTNDINNGFLSVVKTMVTAAPQSIATGLNRALFNGRQPRTAAQPGTTAFNVESATSPNLTTVQVVFNRIPDTTSATTLGNYRIIAAGDPSTFASASAAPISGVTLSGRTATLTATLAANTPYVVVTQNITFAGSQFVNDSVNKLRWQRCRRGTLDNATCADDGDSANDSLYWNDALNYCDSLNAILFDGDTNTASLRYAWRAPTINELKSIANRSLFGTAGVAIDTTTFPTPNVLAEDFASSTNYTLNGEYGYQPPGGGPPPRMYQNFNQAWSFNYIAGFPGLAQKDNSTIIAGLKPPRKSIRCVRSLP